ncbi:MAG TPA: histidine kinase [Thermoleophilaceae bacterium]
MKRLVRPAVALAAFAYGLVAVGIAARHGGATTYAGASSIAQSAELATGWALVAAGLLLSGRPGWTRIGTVLVVAGFAWFARDWVGWEGGPNAIRTAGFLALGLTFAFVVDALVSWPAQAPPSITRLLVGAVYAETVLAAAGRAALRDPFEDPHCWSDCTAHNVLLIHADRSVARALDFVDLRFAVVAGAALAAVAAWRIAVESGPARQRLWLVLVPGAVYGLVHAATALRLVGGRTEDATSTSFAVGFGARSVALICLAAGAAAVLVRIRATRTAVGRLAEALGEAPAPGALEAAMAEAVGDPSLTIAYRLGRGAGYVDRDGRPVEIAPTRGRAATTIVRGADPVAVVLHDPGVIDGGGIARAVGATARLAVDNERLAAEARAHLAELRASRARVVASADAERRRLERDLHDGAQQQLLALSYDLRVARASAQSAGRRELAAELEAALREAEAALDELRELAHGIYPAVLEESGLGPALRTLAARAPLPVELELAATGRVSTAAERATYVAVAEAIGDAADRRATYVWVALSRSNGHLHLRVRDDGAARTESLTDLADRLGALQGVLELRPTAIDAEIPCE